MDVVAPGQRSETDKKGDEAEPRAPHGSAAASGPRGLKILVVGQTPPPHHGQAVMVRHLLDADLAPHELHFVRLDFTLELEDIGRVTARKIGKLLRTITAIIAERARTGSEVLLYVPAGPALNPLLRDIVVLCCVRWMFRWTFFHFHAGGVMEYVATLNRPLRVLARFAYRNPDLTIRTSQAAPADGARCGSRRDIVVQNCAADLELAPQRPPTKRPRLLYVGILKEDKGALVLLHSLRLLHERGHDVELYLVGASLPRSFRDVIEDTIRDYALADRVTLTGVLVGEAKRRIFHEADVFCFPTFYASETFGLVVVEAMSCGLPVVATNWRGLPAVIDDGVNGFIVPPRDPVAFAERLALLLLDRQLRERMGAAGRRKYEAMFTPRTFAQRMRFELDAFVVAAAGPAARAVPDAASGER
jgi:glycosyltransferase involved in cell wall biosynthesis